jgi:membrane-bound lytic murein transglycosylase MltF
MLQFRRPCLAAAGVVLAWLVLAGTGRAELVFLSSGRTLSVKSHRLEGDSMVLTLRAGGQITCEASLIDRIEPDEVPYPDDAAIAAAPDPTLPYASMIDSAAVRAGIDPRLVHAVIRVESAYQAQARSRKGAMGLMQLMPDTARRYSVSDPYDPGANIDAGIRHLKSLLDRFEVTLALAAYNAGEAAVQRFRGIPPYPETQNYVRQVMRLAGLNR